MAKKKIILKEKFGFDYTDSTTTDGRKLFTENVCKIEVKERSKYDDELNQLFLKL